MSIPRSLPVALRLGSLTAAATALTLTLAGCNENPAPAGGVTLSLAVPATPVAPAGVIGLASYSQVDSLGNSLSVSSAQVVLHRIKLEPVGDVGDCEDEDASCHELRRGPFLVDLPLDGGVTAFVDASVPPGSYEKIECKIHKANAEEDSAFVAAHPDFAGISVRVEGTFNGTPFVYTSRVDQEQKLTFDPPLVVAEGGEPVHITLSVNMDTWFRDASHHLFNPSTGNTGDMNEERVRDNIRASLGSFEDENRDGHDDHHEGEGGGEHSE